jgi:mRNA interferase MazF
MSGGYIQKDFDEWNNKKKILNGRKRRVYFHGREIWWCALGTNIGSEEDGTGDHNDRPVVIMRGFGKDTCLVVPLTTSDTDHVLRPSVGIVDGEYARALVSQIRVIDTKRLLKKIGMLEKSMFELLRKHVKDVL